MISSEQLKKIKKIEGKIRGTTFKNDFDYVRKKGGEKAVRKIRKRLKELGCEDEDIYKERVKLFSWYPLWCHTLFFVILNKEMGWSEDDIFNIGQHGPKVSLVLKVIPKGTLNLKRIFKQANTFWKKNYSIGEIELKDHSLDKKYAIFNLKGFNVHPLECRTIQGYVVGMIDILARKKNVEIEEVKCVHRGNRIHQFKLTWE